jgi:hypothetical protein
MGEGGRRRPRAWKPTPALQQRRQILAREARLAGRHGFRRALGDHLAAAGAAFRAHVDQPVGRLDDVEVVLDDHDRVAVVAQLLDDLEQQLDVVEVQAGGRLVEDVQRAAGVALGQFQRQLHALRLAARQRGGRLPRRM